MSQVHATSTWTIQDVQTNGTLGVLSLALDANDDPHITYYKYFMNDYHNPLNLTLASWNGSAWETQTLESGQESGLESSLALDSLNNPHICYVYSTPSGFYLKYTSWTGSEWNNQTVDSSLAGPFGLEPCSIAIDSDDNPHIVYSAYDSDLGITLKYARWSGSNWSIQTIDSEAFSIRGFYGTSISVGSNNYPRVIYGESAVIDGAVTNSSVVRYAEWNGQNWSIQTVYPNVDSFGNLALDSNGYPHFTYLVEASLRYASWDGSTWNTQIVDSNTSISDSSFVALDSHGNPHVSYYEGPEIGSDTGGSLMYAYWNSSAWNTETVTKNEIMRGAGLIVLDSSDTPHLCYSNIYFSGPYSYCDIKYATRIESTTTTSPSTTVVIVVVALVAVVAVTVLTFYFKKRKSATTVATKSSENPSEPL